MSSLLFLEAHFFLARTIAAPAVMGRLKPGVTLDQVNAEFIALARHRLAEDNPKTNQNFASASVQPLFKSFHRAFS